MEKNESGHVYRDISYKLATFFNPDHRDNNIYRVENQDFYHWQFGES